MSSWIISFVVAVVAVCAGLAALGFRGRVTTVGIDLGTTFSVVGISVNGKVSIIEDQQGHRIFPSVVAFDNRGDVVAVAYDALPYLSINPQNTIFNAKRFIGGDLEDPVTQAYAEAHPYKVVPSSLSNYSKVGFELRSEDPADGSSSIRSSSSSSSSSSSGSTSASISASGEHKTIVTPENVGTQVLKYLLSVTAKYLGHSQVNKAVIAVPAKFTPEQRAATGEAYKAAGLKVVRVLEEPTAAAVAYKLHKKSNIHHILVYDFGGGTLDVSLLFVSKGSVQVYATDGDETLGGSDLDMCLYEILKGKIEGITMQPLIMKHDYSGEQVQTDRQTSSSSTGGKKAGAGSNASGSCSDDYCSSAAVRTKAEQAKKELSSAESTTFRCIQLQAQQQQQQQQVVSDQSVVTFEVTRNEFEVGCQPLFDRALAPVTRLLEDLEMTTKDIDEVVLVGGTTRIPLVKRQLRKFFGKELNDHIDPDVTVAYGAASVLD